LNSSNVSLQKFDLVVIGGGPAGYVAAIKGRLAGFRVAVIEKEKIGGACINKGCIPTKALWGTAVHLQRLKDSPEHGIQIGKVRFNFKKAMQRQYGIAEQMVQQVLGRMSRLGVTVIKGEGRLLGRTKSGRFTRVGIYKHSAKKQGPQTDAILINEITSRFVLIATGSHPFETEPLIADHKKILTTDDIIFISKQPKRLVIAGGGVVACEFASIFSKFGTKVHLLEHSSQVLSSMDPEVVDVLSGVYKRDGVEVHTHSKTEKITVTKSGVTVHIRKKNRRERINADMVLIAIGRRPNSKGIGIESMDINTNERGFIQVNEKLETTAKGIYAAGDVIGGQMLAHKAWYDADIAVRAMAGEEVHTNYDTVPGAIFTVPEMASVGLSLEQAAKQNRRVRVGKIHYGENAQAMCVGKTLGLMKAVVDCDSGEVLGCTMVGHDSSNLISEVALAMAAGLTVSHIANTIHPHPTLSEMVHESFLDTQGRSIHKV
jgi:dihydrolipoamide dehydrogenase